MDLQDRILALSAPIRDCCAAIDAARVLATITGKPQVLYREFGDPSRWHVRGVDDLFGGDWVPTGGIYEPDETRSHMGVDPKLTPELAEARGIAPYIELRPLRDEYQRVLVGGWGKPIDD